MGKKAILLIELLLAISLFYLSVFIMEEARLKGHSLRIIYSVLIVFNIGIGYISFIKKY